MNKLVVLGVTSIASLALAGCGNHHYSGHVNNTKKNKTASHKTSQKHTLSRSSSYMSKQSNDQFNSQTNYQNGARDNSSSVLQSSSSNSEIEPKTLKGFINKYGMTPVAYKERFKGMTRKQALLSTPDNMKAEYELVGQDYYIHPERHRDTQSNTSSSDSETSSKLSTSSSDSEAPSKSSTSVRVANTSVSAISRKK